MQSRFREQAKDTGKIVVEVARCRVNKTWKDLAMITDKKLETSLSELVLKANTGRNLTHRPSEFPFANHGASTRLAEIVSKRRLICRTPRQSIRLRRSIPPDRSLDSSSTIVPRVSTSDAYPAEPLAYLIKPLEVLEGLKVKKIDESLPPPLRYKKDCLSSRIRARARARLHHISRPRPTLLKIPTSAKLMGHHSPFQRQIQAA